MSTTPLLDLPEVGWHTVRDVPAWRVFAWWNAGLVKAQRVEHLRDTWQVRLTGKGRAFCSTLRSLDERDAL